MYLKPTDIYFCQDSINNRFRTGQLIGETLDDLCEGRCLLSSFPRIQVKKQNVKWFTIDNRRLWVFRQLYKLGKCGEIPVTETGAIPSNKMTTTNGGVSISIRNGGPGGVWYKKPDGAGANPNGSFDCTWPKSSFVNFVGNRRNYFLYDFDSDSDDFYDDDSDRCSDDDSERFSDDDSDRFSDDDSDTCSDDDSDKFSDDDSDKFSDDDSDRSSDDDSDRSSDDDSDSFSDDDSDRFSDDDSDRSSDDDSDSFSDDESDSFSDDDSDRFSDDDSDRSSDDDSDRSSDDDFW